ncbi:MAG: hypothetical protein ACTSX9_01825 [Candidatus Njordarchaeales archaeon]
MIVEIDDAGVGCPVGGVVIGGLRGNKFSARIIPIDFFKEGADKSILQEELVKSVASLLKELKFKPEDDLIKICRGTFFEPVFAFFEENGWRWMPTKIESRLQDLVEARFDFHLIEIGVPRLLVKRLIHYRDYVIELLKWVGLDLEERKSLVKTSFNVWKREWRFVRLAFEEKKLSRSGYCLECGQGIKRNEEVIEVIFSTPRRILRCYLHSECGEKLKR